MLTPIRPHTPQFAGEPKKTHAKKAGLLGLLLASAGGASALPANNNGLALKGSHNNTASDAFAYIAKTASSQEEQSGGLRTLLSRQSLPDDYTSFDDAPPLYLKDDADDVKARELLKKPAFRPTDIDLFNPSVYPDASPMELAPVTEANEDKIKASLLETLTKRFRGDADKAKKAMKVFDDKDLKEIMPDPKLRAALVNLRGTTGRSAIDVIRNGTYPSVRFAEIDPVKANPNRTIAYVVVPPGKTKQEVHFNTRYQGEDFRLLSDTMAHEALHQDTLGHEAEELINGALDTTVYAQQLLENPELAYLGTELPRRSNTKILPRINGRDEEGNPRLFMPAGSNTTPDGATTKDFGSYYGFSRLRNVRPASPGNAHLQAMLKAVTGEDINKPNFDVKTATLLDENLKSLKPGQLVELAKILKLDINEERTEDKGSNTKTKDDPRATGPKSCDVNCGENSGAHSSASVPKKMLLGMGLGVPAARAFGLF